MLTDRFCILRALGFAVMAVLVVRGSVAAADTLSSLNVYPNPVRAHQGQSAVVFDQLTDQADIWIFTAGGKLVREAHLQNSGFQYQWDLTNDAGNAVASGIYIYVIRNERDERRTGKLAVLR